MFRIRDRNEDNLPSKMKFTIQGRYPRRITLIPQPDCYTVVSCSGNPVNPWQRDLHSRNSKLKTGRSQKESLKIRIKCKRDEKSRRVK